jgi:predicted MFS family arabinose efflux permease
MIGLFNFLFAFPRIQPEFPYVTSNFSTLSTNGYYFVANRNAIGLLWRALPSLGYLGVAPAWRTLNKKEKLMALFLLVPTCIIAPLVIIFSIWESGYGVRYCCDFAWQFILGGTAVLYLLYARVAKGQAKDILRGAFTVAMALGVIVGGAMLYEYLTKTGHLAAHYLRFAKVFDFWM